VVCRHKKGTLRRFKKRKKPRKARRWLREGKVPCVLNQEISFLGSRVFGFWETRLIWISAPTRLSPRGSHVQRKFQKRTTLRNKSSTLKGLLYSGWRSRCECSEKCRTIALECRVSKKAVIWQATINIYSRVWNSCVIPTWAVLRSLANARKCQLEDFCEKKWETHVFCTRNIGAHVRSTSAKKLVSSNFAKILEVATKIRETCEKHCFLPLVQ
jgi:hypothetical protein